MCLQGDRQKVGFNGAEIARVNPLTKIAPEFRKQLRSELQAAKADTRLKGAVHVATALNLPSCG